MPEAAQEILERVRKTFDTYLNPTGDVAVEDVPFIDLGEDIRRETHATDGSTVKEPSLPQYIVERFTQSLQRFGNDLNPGLGDIPTLDLDDENDNDPDELQFWGKDGDRLQRRITPNEDYESSSDDSDHEDEEEDEDDDDETNGKGKEFDLPGHR